MTAAASLLLLTACSGRDDTEKDFSASILTARGGDTVADFTPWDWDELYVFPEGTSKDAVAEKTPVRPSRGLIDSERYYNTTMVFLHDGKVVRSVAAGDSFALDADHIYRPYAAPVRIRETDQRFYLEG